MNLVLKIITRLGLVLTIVPAFLFLFDQAVLSEVKSTMITGTAMWLVFAPLIQKQRQEQLTRPDGQDHI